MKLYIPTSTLNFNNILSTESLSPQAFYGERGFGYRRWTPVPENRLANSITLYERPFRFTRPASDVEDHPMWVEIEVDEAFPTVADGVRLADRTIYFSPWRTRFLFLTEADLRTTWSLAQQSLETKLTPLYAQHMAVRTDLDASAPVNPPKDDMPLNAEAIDGDRRINRMKGLLYGYYLGALLSEPAAVANKRRQLRDLRNGFTALWSASALNQTGIKALRKETQKFFDYLWKEKLTLPDVFNAWWEDEWERLDLRAAGERRLLPTRDEEIVVADGRLAKIAPTVLPNERENKLLLTWANEVLTCPEYAGEPSTFRAALSDALTAAARDLLGTDWEASPLRTQLNAMRRLVRNEANNFRWTDTLTTAAAAVLLWGNDWEHLRTNLRERGTTDFRLALALYGELTGFANLTRDLTDHLFELKDRTYVADVYKEIYGELLGTAADLPNAALKNPIAAPKNPGTALAHRTKPYPGFLILTKFIQQVLDIWERIKRALKGAKGGKKKDFGELESGLRTALEKMGSDDNPERFLDVLAKQKGWCGRSEARKLMGEALRSKQEEATFNFVPEEETSPRLQKAVRKELPRKQENCSLESTQTSESSISQRTPFDLANVDKICHAIEVNFSISTVILRTIKQDLDWIFNYKKNRRKEPQQLLSEFEHALIDGRDNKVSPRGKPYEWKNEQYAQLDIPAIIAYIRENFEV